MIPKAYLRDKKHNTKVVRDIVLFLMGDLHQPKPVTNRKQYLYPFHKDTCIYLPFSSTHPVVQEMLPVDDISHPNTVIFLYIPRDH